MSRVFGSCPLRALLTQEQKEELFRANVFDCDPPPVRHVQWSMAGWIRFIDGNGRWHPPHPTVDYERDRTLVKPTFLGKFKEILQPRIRAEETDALARDAYLRRFAS